MKEANLEWLPTAGLQDTISWKRENYGDSKKSRGSEGLGEGEG